MAAAGAVRGVGVEECGLATSTIATRIAESASVANHTPPRRKSPFVSGAGCARGATTLGSIVGAARVRARRSCRAFLASTPKLVKIAVTPHHPVYSVRFWCARPMAGRAVPAELDRRRVSTAGQQPCALVLEDEGSGGRRAAEVAFTDDRRSRSRARLARFLVRSVGLGTPRGRLHRVVRDVDARHRGFVARRVPRRRRRGGHRGGIAVPVADAQRRSLRPRRSRPLPARRNDSFALAPFLRRSVPREQTATRASDDAHDGPSVTTRANGHPVTFSPGRTDPPAWTSTASPPPCRSGRGSARRGSPLPSSRGGSTSRRRCASRRTRTPRAASSPARARPGHHAARAAWRRRRRGGTTWPRRTTAPG